MQDTTVKKNEDYVCVCVC